MAKKAGVSAYDAGERETIDYLTKLFEAAKFQIQRELDLGGRSRPDLVVGREELGRYRYYAIDVALVREASALPAKLEQLYNYAASMKQPDQFDEFWLVSNLSMPEVRKPRVPRRARIRAFTIKELERMLARLSPKPSAKTKAGKARTTIGKAIEANEKQIALAIEALKLQIEDKLAKLRDERPNDPDAIKKVEATISEYEEMHAELERIKVAVQQFKKNEVKEKEVVRTVTTFKDTVGKWWHRNQETIYTSASNSALFIGATGLLHIIGADSTAALAIAGSLIGGDTVAKVLKSLPRGLFKRDH